MPRCRCATRAFTGPRRRTAPKPRGDRILCNRGASSSNGLTRTCSHLYEHVRLCCCMGPLKPCNNVAVPREHSPGHGGGQCPSQEETARYEITKLPVITSWLEPAVLRTEEGLRPEAWIPWRLARVLLCHAGSHRTAEESDRTHRRDKDQATNSTTYTDAKSPSAMLPPGHLLKPKVRGSRVLSPWTMSHCDPHWAQ